jgi:hypothetical protein
VFDSLLKRFSANEVTFLVKAGDDALSDHVPKFLGVLTLEDGNEYTSMEYLEKGFLFNETHVFDIKIGFSLSRVDDPKNYVARKDYYDRMLEIAPECLDPVERRNKSMCKRRFMELRGKTTTTNGYAFRLDAFRTPKGIKCSNMDGMPWGEVHKIIKGELSAEQISGIIVALTDMVRVVGQSQLLETYNLYGSSILIITDRRKCVTKLIDFTHSFF